jgi:large subunit ribosomal protein L15
MKAHELRPNKGAHRLSRRVGRGDGSGRGNYSGRGMKGQKSRTGGGVRRGFAGGQLSMIKGLPMLRGFTNIFRVEYAPVNLDRLDRFPAGSRVTAVELKEAGILKNTKQRVKILGGGKLDRALTVVAHRFSESARAAIEATGGTAEQV